MWLHLLDIAIEMGVLLRRLELLLVVCLSARLLQLLIVYDNRGEGGSIIQYCDILYALNK